MVAPEKATDHGCRRGSQSAAHGFAGSWNHARSREGPDYGSAQASWPSAAPDDDLVLLGVSNGPAGAASGRGDRGSSGGDSSHGSSATMDLWTVSGQEKFFDVWVHVLALPLLGELENPCAERALPG